MSLFRGDKARNPTAISKAHAHCGVLAVGMHLHGNTAYTSTLENLFGASEFITICKGFDGKC